MSHIARIQDTRLSVTHFKAFAAFGSLMFHKPFLGAGCYALCCRCSATSWSIMDVPPKSWPPMSWPRSVPWTMRSTLSAHPTTMPKRRPALPACDPPRHLLIGRAPRENSELQPKKVRAGWCPRCYRSLRCHRSVSGVLGVTDCPGVPPRYPGSCAKLGRADVTDVNAVTASSPQRGHKSPCMHHSSQRSRSRSRGRSSRRSRSNRSRSSSSSCSQKAMQLTQDLLAEDSDDNDVLDRAKKRRVIMEMMSRTLNLPD